MAKRNPQLKLLKDLPKAYGGELLKTRKGRVHGRPLDTKNSIHMVLYSSLAKGTWSFRYKDNPHKIRAIIEKFARKFGIKVISLANVGNHLHLQIKLSNRFTYKKFIRAITAAIAMAITGMSRWNIPKSANGKRFKFWDYRPFTRVIQGFYALLKLQDYIRVNQLQGFGYKRADAAFMLKIEKHYRAENTG